MEATIMTLNPKSGPKIRGVAFDANGVLYYREVDVVEGVMAAAAARGLVLPADARKSYKEITNRAMGGSMTREQMIRAILDAWGLFEPEERQRVAEEIVAASRAIHLYPGVLSTLARLRQLGISVGVITNTFQSAAEKWRWFVEQNLAPYLDRIIASSEVGLVKPDPAIYRLYVTECGLSPEEVAFVGHDLEELEGARAAGLLALAFRPDRPGFFQPEFYDFPALLPLIGAADG